MPRKELKLQDIIVDNLEDAVAAVDKNGVLKLLNQQAGKIFNIAPKDVLGKKIWDAIPFSEFNKLLLSVMRVQNTTFLEKVVILNHNRPFQIKFFRAVNSEGRIIGAIALLRDLSDFAKIEKALNNYVANISHELKTPLTAIKGYVETMLETSYASDPEISKKFLQIINDETNRMTRLIMSMLEMSRSDNQTSSLELMPVSVKKVLETAVSLFKSVAEQKNIEIKTEIVDGLPMVCATEDRLKQIFINLIDNAVKYTGIKKSGQIKINAIDAGKYLRVSITDSGIGIPQEHMQNLFERFYRVQEGQAAQLGGTGLGLSITKKLIEEMSGTIEIQSEPDKGTKVTFSLLLSK